MYQCSSFSRELLDQSLPNFVKTSTPTQEKFFTQVWLRQLPTWLPYPGVPQAPNFIQFVSSSQRGHRQGCGCSTWLRQRHLDFSTSLTRHCLKDNIDHPTTLTKYQERQNSQIVRPRKLVQTINKNRLKHLNFDCVIQVICKNYMRGTAERTIF